jgi:predicted acylesterase/phospholipase RssA
MIYTLYSYKGGVGRSMALANLGECFFQKGLKVVMIDWDLEAPGLETYFFSDARERARVTARRGLIDMLREYKEKYPELAQPKAAAAVEAVDPEEAEEIARDTAEVAEITKKFLEKHGKRVPERLRRVEVAAPADSPPLSFDEILDQGLTPIESYLEQIEISGDSGLWLLTAGTRSAEKFTEYAEAVQDFDWVEFLTRYQGKKYLEWLRTKLEWADVVLIDSRTGVTEMGGVCTRQMAEAVVTFCAPNSQNVDGVARIISSLTTDAAKQARFERDLQVLVIPTRIDDSESALLGQFFQDFDSKLEAGNLPREMVPMAFGGIQRPLWNLQVPYIPKFNYREQLVIGPRASRDGGSKDAAAQQPDPPTQKLIRAYDNIAVHLAALAKSGTHLRLAYSSEIVTQFPGLEPPKPPRMAPPLPGKWVERRAATVDLMQKVLACAKAPNGGRVAVCGMAGTGKTYLVARVCQEPEIVATFPDGIVWLTLEGAWGKERAQDFLRATFGIPRQGGDAELAHALEEKRFLFVVDDVWTPEQLYDIFRWGKRFTRLIITRDLAIAARFADTVVTVGNLSNEESRELLNVPAPRLDAFQNDPALRPLLTWPLGASLISAAVERYSAQTKTPERGSDLLLEQLKTLGLKALDRPGVPGRNGSASLSLRESLMWLQPAERRLLMTAARAGAAGIKDDPNRPEASRRLKELGLLRADGETLSANEVVCSWVLGQPDLTEDAEAGGQAKRRQDLEKGNAILRGQAASLNETWDTAELAKDVRAFSLARKLFALARRSPEASSLTPTVRLKLLQRHALCTYKDDDLVADERFEDALVILNEGDLPSPNASQETLGQAGAIHKTKWRLSGQRRDLEHSLNYYQRGAQGELEGDFGYTRINAAFVLDLLAKQEQDDSPVTAQTRREQANRYREEIAAKLPDLAAKSSNAWLKGEWWYGATMAEALFGLKRYPEARHWLREASVLDPPAWQLETTTRQMAMLALAQDVGTSEDSEAWRTIAMLVGDSTEAVRGITTGKVGLALSGGGFRASLFHIGVLARLAELDVLRHVEVLSCVSGGSIIGAHYYLEVRRLLQEKRDREITREDYIDIVKRLEQEFLAGVQKNLRGRLFAGWLANWKSLVVRGYTRTKYLGEMFERHIYSRVKDGEDGDRWLDKLEIRPKDASPDFNPKLDNWRRSAKVPILLLNATTLNTGHVWQFAVRWMGEPPQSAKSSVDSNDLLRRMYYSEAPVTFRHVRLGHAVAASACVPALFDPIEFDGLFPRRRLRLVDGGVHDNQGVAGLLEQECTVVLVSDASGQMNSERRPSGNILPVLIRSNSISMARIRESGFRQLDMLRRSSALGGLMFLHLKKDLEIPHVDWVDCQEPYDASANPGKTRSGATITSYGMPNHIQALLAGVRTDLDTFSDAEAFALMLSGYRMASTNFNGDAAPFPVAESSREPWRFLAVAPTVDRATDYEPEHERLQQILSVGSGLALKAFHLRPFASWATLAGLAALLYVAALSVNVAALNVAVFDFGRLWHLLPVSMPLAVGGLEFGMAAVFCAILLGIGIFFLQRKNLSIVLTGLVVVTVGWLIARIHLWCFDPIYRRAGAVRTRRAISGDAAVD